MNQKIKSGIWKDEAGKSVPVEYVSPAARLREKHASTLLKESIAINNRLTAFKKQINKLCQEVIDKAMNELNVENSSKGNFVWHNFDRSIKVEVKVNDRIEFDDITISACKAKLDEFLNESLGQSKVAFLKDMITDAFSTSHGKLDSKKVMSLMKYQSKIQDPIFQEALKLLANSIRRPDSKTYFRVWEREPDGSYKNIELNFSSI